MTTHTEAPDWQRPAFAAGNVAHLVGGYRSPRVYGELAALLAAGIMADRPDLERYPEAVAAWATAESQAALLRRRVDEVGALTPEGDPRDGLLTWLHKAESAAAKHRAALGLDPTSEARLSRDRAAAAALSGVDLRELAAQGRVVLAEREELDLPPAPDLAGSVLAQMRSGLEGRAS